MRNARDCWVKWESKRRLWIFRKLWMKIISCRTVWATANLCWVHWRRFQTAKMISNRLFKKQWRNAITFKMSWKKKLKKWVHKTNKIWNKRLNWSSYQNTVKNCISLLKKIKTRFKSKKMGLLNSLKNSKKPLTQN